MAQLKSNALAIDVATIYHIQQVSHEKIAHQAQRLNLCDCTVDTLYDR